MPQGRFPDIHNWTPNYLGTMPRDCPLPSQDNLLKSDDHLRLANGKVDDLTIRKLTYKNPTMKAKFDPLHKIT